MATCKLCLNSNKTLRNSHSIPRAVFRKLLGSDGKFTHHKIDEDNLGKGQDQGAELMLCDDCEGLLSRQYENYALRVLRDGYSEPDGNGMILSDVNLNTINMYCLSVYWRCMVSGHGLFHEIKNIPEAAEWYRPYLLNNTPISRTEFAVRILRLDGRRLGFPADGMKGQLLNPTSTRLPKGGVVVRFLYGGYLFEKYPFCYGRSVKHTEGLVRKNKRHLRVPDIDLTTQDWYIDGFNKTVRKMKSLKA